MDQQKVARLLPLSETAYYILLCLQRESHGYAIMQQVADLTENRITLGPGTVYGTLAKMEKDRLIKVTAAEKRRKMYLVTEKGRALLDLEIQRLRELVNNSEKFGR